MRFSRCGATRWIRCFLVALACHWLGVQTLCAAPPGARPIEDLELTGDWVLEQDGHPVAGATVHFSKYEVAWLVDAPMIEPVLVSPRSHSVLQVTAPLDPVGDGETGVRLAVVEPSEVGASLAPLTQDGGAFEFVLGEHSFRLAPAPPLLGRQTWEILETRHPKAGVERSHYGDARADSRPSLARREDPSSGTLEKVTVRVYFGSWSSASLRLVPRIAAVEEAWHDQGVHFEYYGLPRPLTDDQEAVDDRVVGVPTVVVKRGETELGRITGRQLADPAASLSRILSGGSS